MAIRVECIFCHTSLAVHDKFAGREVKCPQCNNRLSVPKKSDSVQFRRSSKAAQESGVEDPPDSNIAPIHSENGHQQEKPRWVGDLERIAREDSEQADAPQPPPKKRHVARTEEEELEWDVTPMVDVAFLLLIFFMITASFSIQKAIPMAPPQEDAPGQATTVRETQKFREIITLQIDEFNGYTLIGSDGSEAVSASKQELITQLEEMQTDQGADSVKIMVLAHKMSHHGALVSGLDAARKAGYVNFQVQAVDEF